MKGILRLEIEKLQSGLYDSEKSFENRSTNGDLGGHPNMVGTTSGKYPSYRTDGRQNSDLDSHSADRIELDRNGSISHGLADNATNDVSIVCLYYL